jgi:hypothetical protein
MPVTSLLPKPFYSRDSKRIDFGVKSTDMNELDRRASPFSGFIMGGCVVHIGNWPVKLAT